MFSEDQLLNGTGLPPVLPSLAKPKPQPSTPSYANLGRDGSGIATPSTTMPSTALPPVTATNPSPEDQRVSAVKNKLQTLEKPSFTQNLWDKTKGSDSFIGKLGHVGAGLLRGVEVAGEIAAPKIMASIPGTTLNKSVQTAATKKDLGEAEKEATEASTQTKNNAEAAKDNAEAEVAKNPKEDWSDVMASGAPVLNAQGQPLQVEKHSGTYRYGNVSGVEVTPKKPPTTQQEAQQAWDTWTKTNPDLVKKGIPNPFHAGMPEDEFKEASNMLNQALGKEQGQTHIQISQEGLADKEQKQLQENSQTVNQGRMNLYAQQNYYQNAQSWLKSVKGPQYAKDVALITDVLNHEKTGGGVLSGVVGGTSIGALLGGPGGAGVGAAIGTLSNVLNGPASSILDSLKRQGISPQGYAAMQAYLNALPARMAFEIGTQGLKASSMRFGALINKVMNTLPPPNTPQASFNNAFRQYYTPMKAAQELKEKGTKLPSDYTPPDYTYFYPPEEKH